MSRNSLRPPDRTSRLLTNLTSALRKSHRPQEPRRLSLEPLDARRVLAVVIGDFNGDGYGDLATGIPGEDIGTIADAGAVSVIYGTNLGLQATGDQLWHQDTAGVEGVAETGDRFGQSLAVGDFNNDGYNDLAIGAPGEDVEEIQEAGAVNVLYGSASGLTAVNNQIFYQDVAGVLEVSEASDRFGSSVTAGDFNGDGYDDLAIGVANENSLDQQDAGLVHILYGSVVRLRTSGNQIFAEGVGGVSGDSGRYDLFGAALVAGDFNGDGRDDLAIGAPGENTGTLHDVGAVTILYGTASGLAAANNVQYTQDSVNVPDTGEAWDSFGAALAAGDFDNDGYDDLAIGSPNEDVGALVDAGAVHVMYGRSAYQFDSARHQMWTQDTLGIFGVSESRDYFGASLAAGNFNHGGHDDLVIGAPGENEALTDTGAVNLLYGGGSGLSSSGNQLYTQNSLGVEGVEEVFDFFGSSVTTGDTNGDGYADLAVAIAGEAIGAVQDAGAVQVFRGQSTAGPGVTGLRTDNDFIWHQDVANIEFTAEASDFFGGERPGTMLHGNAPALNSNPGAAKHLFLDFDGGISSGIYTGQFDLDNQSSFNRTERSMIEDIWAYVSEDFAPFNINVTTVLPTVGEVFRVLIGGDGSERQDDPTSGWGPGDYTDASNSNNDVYTYSKRIQSWYGVNDNLAARIGTTSSHEAGHGFGLGHKSTFDSSDVKLDTYSDGGADWTPIMGNNLATDRTIWAQPYVSLASGNYAQGSDDYNVLKNELGLRADDHGATLATATNLGSIGVGQSLLDTGLLTRLSDKDLFRFDVTAAGSYSIAVEVADVGANLDSTLQLLRSDGSVFAISSPTGNLDASLFRSLGVGTYYAKVGSEADFTGDLGRYTLRVAQVSLPILPLTYYPIDTSLPSVGLSLALGGETHDEHGAGPHVEPAPQQSAATEANLHLKAWDAAIAQWELTGSGRRGTAQASFASKASKSSPELTDHVLGMLGADFGFESRRA